MSVVRYFDTIMIEYIPASGPGDGKKEDTRDLYFKRPGVRSSERRD